MCYSLHLRESFGSDFPVLRLHSDRGGEFSSARLGAFCRAQGIRQTFTLPASPQQNGIAERRIGMVMDVARTSMIHAAAPHFLWPFAVQYAAHQLNLQPRVSVPETSHTLRWTGKVGDASAFRVWGSRAFVRDLSSDKLSPCAVPCVFLGFPPDAPGWQFYHPTSRRVLSSQDVTFDGSVPFYRLFPYRTAPLPPPPLFLAPGPPPVDPLPPQGPAPSGVSQVDAVEPVEVAVDSGATRGAEPVGAGSGGAESGGAEPGGAEPGGAESGGAEPGGAESEGAEPGGAEPGGAESARVASRGASSRRELLSPQELREWFARRWSRAAGAGGSPVAPGPGGARTGGTGAVGTGGGAATAGVCPAGASGATGGVDDGVGATGASGAAGAGATGGVGAGAGPAGGTAGGTGVAGPAGVGAVGAAGAAGAGAATGGTGAVPVGSGGPARPRPYFVPLLEQVLGLPPSPGPAPPLECPQPVQSQSPLQPVSPLPAPSPYAVPGTHQMSLRPSTAPLRVPLPSPPVSSLPVLADPESDSLRATSPTVARLLATVVTDPSFESTAASALVAELLDFAACCRLDYATSLVAASASVCPPSVGGEWALGTDVLEDQQEEFQCFAAALPHLVSMLIAPEGDPDAPDIPTPRSYAEAIEGPYSSQWQSTMDAEMASWKSTGTYVDEVPPPGGNIVSGMWIFRVKRPSGSPPVFKARYVARGFSFPTSAASWRVIEGPTPVVATSSEGGVKHVREESALTVQTAWTWSSSTAFVLTSMAPLPDGRHVAVADRANHIILKIELPLSATSAVSVLAGNNGTNGFMDGRGELALFDTPMHLAADCRGNLFVVDRNSYLRVVSPQGDVTTIRRSSSVSHLAPPQPPFMHSTHAPTTTTLVLDPPVRALLARTRHSDETQSPSASPCAGISGGEKQPLHFHSKPRHADPAKLGSGVSGMWYNASSGVLYVVDTGRQRIAAFAPATTTAAAAAAAAAHAAGNAAGYVAVTTEAAGSVAATGSGVSFRGDAGIPGCLCSAKNSSGGGGGQDAPSSSAWNATWRDTEVAGGAFAVGVLCAHGKPILTATAAGTSHLASTLSLIFHRIASTALAVLMLLFSLPSRFMQQPLGTDPDNTTTSSSSTMQWPLILHPSTQQHGGGEQREEEGVIPPKASLLSLAWPFRSSAARPEAPAAVEENEESGLLISFSDEEDAVGGGNADDTSPSITSQHAPGAPLDIMQLHSSAEMPVSTGSSVDSTARVMTGKEFDRAVASGDAAGAASAAGSTAGAALGRNGDGTAASSFSDLVGKWAGGAHLGEGEKRDTRRDVSS
ncbi:unnamed protein product [Closterium sp. NIES-54]